MMGKHLNMDGENINRLGNKVSIYKYYSIIGLEENPQNAPVSCFLDADIHLFVALNLGERNYQKNIYQILTHIQVN